MSIPNLKRIALFVQKLLYIGGPKVSKLGHVTQATPIYGSFYIPYAGGVRPPSLYQIKADSSFRSKVITGPKISILGHVTIYLPGNLPGAAAPALEELARP